MELKDNSTNIVGTLHCVGDTKTFSSGFTKREAVIKTDGDYPQFIPVEFIKDKTEEIDPSRVGQRVSVFCFCEGRPWEKSATETKYFPSFKAWKVTWAQQTQQPLPTQGVPDSMLPAQSNVGDDTMTF